MRADGGWCCSILWYYRALDANWWSRRRKMAGPEDHSHWLRLLYNPPLFPVLGGGMEAALARFPATVVMYNFNVGTRGASKKNFIKCSLKLKFSWEVGLTQTSCYQQPALYIFGKFNQLLHCWSNWQIGNIVTSGQEGHTVTQAPISNNTLQGNVTGSVLCYTLMETGGCQNRKKN